MRPIYNLDTKREPWKAPKETSLVRRTIEKLTQDNSVEDTWYLRSVRNLINVFEQKERTSTGKRTNLSKAKSKSYAFLSEQEVPSTHTKNFASLFDKSSAPPAKKFDTVELDAVKHSVLTLKAKIDDYGTIDNQQYISYQNQIIGLLTKIGNLESNGNQLIKLEKQKCLRMVQNCNTILKKKTVQLVDVSSVIESEPTESLKFSKVQQLKNMFESKKTVVQRTPTKSKVTKPSLSLEPQHTYDKPLSRASSNKKRLELSKSCENISQKEFTGIKKLLERLRSSKGDLGSTQSLSNGLSEDYQQTNHLIEEEVSLVSVKLTMEADENSNALPAQPIEEPPQNGYLKAESVCSSNEDSGSEDAETKSGFYSLVGEEVSMIPVEEKEESDPDSESTNCTVKSNGESLEGDPVELIDGALISNVFVDYSGEKPFEDKYNKVVYNYSDNSVAVV